MKITVNFIPQTNIEDFAKAHGLELEVLERELPIGSPVRFYAHFKHAEVKAPGVLCSISGDGRTPEEAVDDYARKIEFRTLVLSAYSKKRREIKVPRMEIK